MKPITIGDKVIGHDCPTYMIAELSGNHGGDLNNCVELLHAACDAGADAIKIQAYTPDTITLNCDNEDFSIAPDNAWASYGNLYNLYRYAHTPWDWFPTLFAVAQQRGVELFGSVFDETSVDALQAHDCKAYKIASPEIIDTGLLTKVAKTGKPVIVSTGLANLSDIDEAVKFLRNAGCEDIILLKCTTAYPTPPREVNLRTIQHLEDTFHCLSGLSDHSEGIGISIGAVAMGAHVIEKHVKLETNEETVDSFFSLTPSEFKTLIQEIRRVEAAIGEVDYALSPEALKNKNGRRSLYISADVQQGEPFSEDNIKSVRPGYGLHPKYKNQVIGRTAKRDLKLGDRLTWDVIDS
ncbi:pseudaminic acid synthase [Magnetovibrio sp. PR-2]|uniref:pseudaminic acid synthase n=1 Tax=Magnetovibrio sp. PR-2 TaxID=3120356 RepID=UPI002FCE0449